MYGVKVIALGLFLLSLASRPLYGYVDPNTGGLIFQFSSVLFAVLSAMLFFFSRHLRAAIARGKRVLRSLFHRQKTTEAAEESTTSDPA